MWTILRKTEDKWELAENFTVSEHDSHARAVIMRGARGALRGKLCRCTPRRATGGAEPPRCLVWVILPTVQGEYATALKFCQESLVLWREAGDTNGCALATNLLGEISRAMGEYARQPRIIKRAAR